MFVTYQATILMALKIVILGSPGTIDYSTKFNMALLPEFLVRNVQTSQLYAIQLFHSSLQKLIQDCISPLLIELADSEYVEMEGKNYIIFFQIYRRKHY